MVVVEVYRAIDHFTECKEFIIGHRKVLQVFDIANITSANLEWAFSPSSVVLMIKREEDGKLIGGARLQLVDDVLSIPLEEAIQDKDVNVHDYLKSLASNGAVGEICGLWNTREGAKLGIGGKFLTRSAFVVANQLNLRTSVMLCAPTTVKMAASMGCDIITELGEEGKFYYPKIDLIATAMIKKDATDLTNVNTDDRKIIENLLSNPEQVLTHVTRSGNEVVVNYNLKIK